VRVQEETDPAIFELLGSVGDWVALEMHRWWQKGWTPLIDANWRFTASQQRMSLDPYGAFPSRGVGKADFQIKLDGIGWKIGDGHEIVNWMELEV
jgi:hypothetical protein